MQKIVAMMLVIALIVGMIPLNARAIEAEVEEISLPGTRVEPNTQSRIDGFSKNYTLTGNGASDMVAIALAQENRTGSQFGYTEEWCADFVSDCAILAGQGTAIPQYGGVGGLYDRIIGAGGRVTTSSPQPGDICFIDWNGGSSMGHVEIVYQVSGTTVYTIGGNSGSGSTLYTRTVKKHAPLSSGYVVSIVRPAYQDQATSYLNRCTYYPSYVSIKTPSASKLWNIPCSDSTSDDAVNIAKTSAGETLTATALYLNTAGNYWYRVSYNGTTCYLYGGNTTYQTAYYSDVAISNVVAPSRITQGSTFAIGGTITSTYNYINYIEANVYSNATDDRVLSSSVTVNTRSYSLRSSTIDNELTFNTLGAGSYAYDINARVRNYYTPDGDALQSEYLWIDLYSTDFTVASQNPTPTTYTVTYNANGGSGAPASQTKTAGTALTLSTTVPSRFGYSFRGWATSSSASSPSYLPGDSYTNDANVTLYAVWAAAEELSGSTYGQFQRNASVSCPDAGVYYAFIPNANTVYRITSSAEQDTRVYLYDADGNLLASDDDSGGNLNFLLTYDFTANETYYIYVRFYGSATTGTIPITISKRYSITYDANGGTGAPAAQYHFFDEAVTLSTEEPTRSGHVFQGWGRSSASESATYFPGDECAINMNLSLYAVWDSNSYTVRYDANGGSGAPDAQEKTAGTDLTLSAVVPTRFGYKFLGWATSSSASSPAYLPGASYRTEADVTLYALWQSAGSISNGVLMAEKRADIIFADQCEYYRFTPNFNGKVQFESTGDCDSQIYLYDADGTQLIWNDDGGENRNFLLTCNVTSGSQYYVKVKHYGSGTGTVIFTVMRAYDVTYDANGGSGAPSAQLKVYDTDLTLSATEPTRSGYTFLGWATSSNASAALYQPGDTYGDNAQLTLYAVWQEELQQIASGTCGDNLEWVLSEDGVLTIFGSGAMTDFSSFGSPWFDYKTQISSIVIEQGVTSIGDYAFNYCENVTSVQIPDSVTVIGSSAFDDCSSLPELILPDGLISIGSHAFYDCNSLSSIIIPASVTTIENHAFWDCLSLQQIVVDSGNEVYSSQDGVLYNKQGSTLITYPAGKEGEFHIPETVTTISGFAFYNASKMNAVTIPNYVTNIGDSAFRGCKGLQTVEIPESISTIPQYMFSFCESLSRITIPTSVTLIEYDAFAYCDNLTQITFVGDAPEFAEVVFLDVTADAYYPARNSTWTADVMQDYGGTITWRKNGAAQIATGYSGALTWVLTDDGVLTFSGDGKMKNYTYKSEMPWYPYFGQITQIILEEGVTSIGDYAFYGMPNLLTISIPESVTTIGNYAFKNCPVLDGVMLPGQLNKLGESAFYACTSLRLIEIPASLWTIQPYTFKNCTALETILFNEGNLMKISDGAFYNTAVTELVLPDCLTILDVYSFKNCAKLESITLSGSLTQIREAVFYGTAIPTIEIPEGVTSIGPYAFKNCVALETIDLPETLTSVGEASFYACTALQSLELPDAVTKIGNYAFRKCAELRRVTFSDSLVNIGESSFYGCESLFYLAIPGNVTTIQGYAFKGCLNLGIVELPESLKTLGDSAFHTCTSLSEITIPASVTKVGEYCFSGSTGIDDIYFLGDAPTIGTGAFNKLTATAYYPGGNSTWTAAVRQNYGGTITWSAQ